MVALSVVPPRVTQSPTLAWKSVLPPLDGEVVAVGLPEDGRALVVGRPLEVGLADEVLGVLVDETASMVPFCTAGWAVPLILLPQPASESAVTTATAATIAVARRPEIS